MSAPALVSPATGRDGTNTTMYGVISRLMGAVLLLAALLKIQGNSFAPVAQEGIFAAHAFRYAVIEFEIILGLWLLWGKYPVASWTLTVLTFLGFAGVSAYAGHVGRASCGCFGTVQVNPWVIAGFDVFVLLLLLIFRPRNAGRHFRLAMWGGGAKRTILALAGVSVALGAFVLIAVLWFGSVDTALAWFRGERISANPSVLDFGEYPTSQQLTVQVELINRTDQPIRIIGGTLDCTCSVVTNLPITAPPHGKALIAIQIHTGGTPGLLTHKASLLTDDPLQPAVLLQLVGRVTAALQHE